VHNIPHIPVAEIEVTLMLTLIVPPDNSFERIISTGTEPDASEPVYSLFENSTTTTKSGILKRVQSECIIKL